MKKILFLIATPVILLSGYVWVNNIGAENMTVRQKILRSAYPLLQALNSFLGSKKGSYLSDDPVPPPVSFHALKWVTNSGEETDMSAFKGKKVLIVNTASDCGFTPQFNDLETLQQRFSEVLVVIGFPANDFKEQEKGADGDIAQFCRKNYGVTFPLAEKSSVVKGPGQNPVFSWLSDPAQNGWNARQPVWNFSKYLVDEQGRLMGFFESAVNPGDRVLVESVETKS